MAAARWPLAHLSLRRCCHAELSARRHPRGDDDDAWGDLKVIYQQPHEDIDINAAPAVSRPEVGPFKLTNLEKVCGTVADADIFDERGLSRDDVMVVFHPDQYVANVQPLTATDELAAFFAPLLHANDAQKV